MKKSDNVLIINIGDLHYGSSLPSEELYRELSEVFIPFVEKSIPKYKDIWVNINGDLFDDKIPKYHPASIYANKFVHDLHSLDVFITILHGTLSHDRNQIDAYSHYLSDRFRIYKTVAVDVILGIKVLFLPEEYPSDRKKYYDPYLNPPEPYDYVFGHGMFSHVGAAGYESHHKRMVTFEASWFDKIVKGAVVYNHIHSRIEYKKIYYPGSFSRWSMGEEDDKGFYSMECNPQNNYFQKPQFHVNHLAPTLKSFSTSDMNLEDSQKLSEYIKDLLNKYDKVRVVIDSPLSPEINHLIVGISKVEPKFVIKKEKGRIKKDEVSEEIDAQRKKEAEERSNKINMYKGKHWFEITQDIALKEHNVSIDFQDMEIAISSEN